MGSRNEGFKSDHLLSKCCNQPIRFIPTSCGYSLQAWCSKCGNYIFNGRTEALIALWMGDFESVIRNKGYKPDWVETQHKELGKMIDDLILEIQKLTDKLVKNIEEG